MKKLLFIPLIVLMGAAAFAQSSAKKYVLIEHFTNSWCGICASRNPSFYASIVPYAADIHHISIHPSVPYQGCVFYQANKSENQARADFYGVPGTPRVALNGTFLASGSTLLPVATLQSHLNKTSPIAIKVTDAIAGSNFTTTLDISYLGNVPSGNYRLFVAVVEKTINLTTPNNEKVHHDVFRDMLTAIAGNPITPGAAGTTAKLTFTGPINAAWQTSELYALAFLQNVDTKEVLNSGTKFDLTSSASNEPLVQRQVRVYPNPTRDVALVPLENDAVEKVEAYTLSGQRTDLAFSNDNQQVQVETDQLAPGVYVLKITGRKGVYTARMLRQ